MGLGTADAYVLDSMGQIDLARGFSWLARLRISNFWTGKYAAEAGMISSRYKRNCPCCERAGAENIEHFLFRCKAFKQQRGVHLRVWTKLIKRGLSGTTGDPIFGHLSSQERRRLHLDDADAATRALLLGGGAEYLYKYVGPEDLAHFGIPSARGSGDVGKANTLQKIRLRLFRDVAGFLAAVMPKRGPLLWATSMSASSRRAGDPG